MASKSNDHVGKPTRGRSARKTLTAAPAAAPPEQPTRAKNLLRAGLKALNDVRDDVLTRQSRVFEALLGIDTAATARDTPRSIDASAQHKFEEVFDQRVARALERLGVPSPQALAALCQQLEAINEHLRRIDSPPAKKRAPRRRAPKP